MKHLFVVHSPITALAAEAVQSSLDLDHDDVVLFMFRPLPDVVDGVMPLVKTLPTRRNVLGARRMLRRFDRFLEASVGGDSFSAYLPTLVFPPSLAIASHPACGEVSMIEEGIGAYVPDGEGLGWRRPASRFTRLLTHACYGTRADIPDRPDSLTVSGSFAFGEEAFPWIASERRTIIEFPFTKNPGTRSDSSGAVPTLVLEPLVDEGDCDLSAYLDVITRLLCRFEAEGVRELRFKFHPNQRISREPLGRLLGTHTTIRANELDATTSLEELAWLEGGSFYGTYSSALFYAGLLGANAYSVASWFETTPRVQELYELVPETARARIVPLSP